MNTGVEIMAKIEVETKNIGGLDKMKASLELGSVNIVKGSSASGKSSLMRGIHLGIVGRPLMEEVYEEEAEKLHIDDRSSDQALLKRGASEGSVTINTPSSTMSASIPSSGMIKGSNSVPKGLFTTMLSALPPTRLHRAVNDPESENPNDFIWVVDDLSEAGKFSTWHKVLNSLDQEVKAIRLNFNNWKSSLAGADTRREEITNELATISARMTARAGSKGAEEAAVAKKIESAMTVKTKNEAEFRRLEGEYQVAKSTNEHQLNRKKSAETQKKIAERKLDDAEDLLEMEFIEPNTTKLDAAIAAANAKVEAARGDANSDVKMIVDVWVKVKDSTPPSLSKVIEMASKKLGDSSKLAAAMSEYQTAKNERDGIVKKYLENKRKFGMAEQQAAAARADIKAAKETIKDAGESMTVGGGRLEKMEQARNASKRSFAAASKELTNLQASQTSSDPEDIADQKEQRKLQDELSNLENTTTFDIHFRSLNMLANQTMSLSQEDAEKMLGSGEGGSAKEKMIRDHLTKGESEIRSLIITELDRGFLNDLTATSTWAAEEADRQRQETRRVFNEVGTTLFNRLKVSPITGVSLNTEYQLQIAWSDGKTTGLTGSGGERAIISAAMLIAMRKAYTPEVPILMFDGIMETLDEKPREEFLSFLDEYAQTEDVAIVASIFDSSNSVATVKAR